MDFFIFWTIFIVFFTVFIPTRGQTTSSNILTDTTKISEKDILDNSKGNFQQNERVSASQENNDKVEEKSPHILSGSRKALKEIKPASKNSQPPINLVIDTKLRAIPIKNPLIMKSGNVKPGPAHYIRIKGNTDRKNSNHKSEATSSSNEQNSRKRATVKDKVISKSIRKPSHRHKSKNLKFFEDNNDTLPIKEINPVKPIEYKKMKNNHHSTTTLKPEKETYDEVKLDTTSEHEIVHDFNKTTNIKNATQPNIFSKVPPSIQYEMKPKETNEVSTDKNLQGFVPKEKPTTLPANELDTIPTFISENTTAAVFAIDYNTQNTEKLPDSKHIDPTDKEATVPSVDPESELPEIITIKDHNYQEVEERRLPSYPEQVTVDEYTSAPWATETLSPVSISPYDSNVQSYQRDYNNDLQNMAQNNLHIYNEGNLYLRRSYLDPINTYTPELSQILSPPAKEVVQDIYGPNPGYQSNIINVRPENSVGRIWRTWKDTEIKLNRPKYANSRPLQFGSNFYPNRVNYNEHIDKTPWIQRVQPGCPNGNYNNFDNMWQYPYFYQFNPYLG